MKKRISILMFLMPLMLLAQEEGIQFAGGNWQEVLQKAKQENKLIFIDVYTTWCGPCKQMVKEVFPLKDVADKFNTSFINYKIDAEKGEGVELAKKFSVFAFPTYLFVNGDGKLYYRSSGSMPKDKFLQEANIALGEFKDPKPLPQWDEEYKSKKKDINFLFSYIEKRTKIKKDNSELIEEYMKLSSEKELLQQKDRLKLFMSNQLIQPGGQFFTFRLKQPKEIAAALDYPVEYVTLGLMDNLYFYMKKTLEEKDKKMLGHLLKGSAMYPAGDTVVAFSAGELKARFYEAANDPEKLIAVIVPFMEKEFLTKNLSGLKRKDDEALERFELNLKEGKIDTSKMTAESLATSRKYSGNGNRINYAYKVRDMAKLVFNIVDDKAILAKALSWVDHAKKYSDNFTMDELYGNILYKMGDKEQGVAYMQKSLDNFLKAGGGEAFGITDRLTSQLEKMKKGEKTWK